MKDHMLVDCLGCHGGHVAAGTQTEIAQSILSQDWIIPQNGGITTTPWGGDMLSGHCPKCHPSVTQTGVNHEPISKGRKAVI